MVAPIPQLSTYVGSRSFQACQCPSANGETKQILRTQGVDAQVLDKDKVDIGLVHLNTCKTFYKSGRSVALLWYRHS